MKTIFSVILAVVLFCGISYAQSDPESVFNAYKSALQSGDRGVYLNLLTAESRAIVNPSPALLQNEYVALKDLDFSVEIENSDRAVVNFVSPSSKVPPYILKKENGQWKMDLKTMRETIVFDHNNEWHRR